MRPDLEIVKRAWAEWLGRLPWNYMLTMTFDPKRFYGVKRGRASRETWQWLDYQSWTFRGTLTWVYAVERGRSGQWHSHVLVMGGPDDDWEILNALNSWEQRNGRTEPSLIRGAGGAVLYLTKDDPYTSELVLAPNLLRFKDLLGERQSVALAEGPCPCR